MDGTAVADRTEAIAGLWLGEFGAAMEARDAARVAALFAADGWWRDLLALTWDLRTFHGTAAVAAALETALPSAAPARFELEPGKDPILVDDSTSRWIQAFFRFDTVVGRGRGFLRLTP